MANQAGTYSEWLKQDMGALIDSVGLTDLQKHLLRSRWLDQVLYMESRSNSARDWYYRLRMTTIIGGVIIPALVSLNLTGDYALAVRGATFVISLLVGISAAVEEFFHYGERWRHYRQTSELMKMEGWNFFQLSGAYERFGSCSEAYREFASRSEMLIQHDVDVYISQVAQEKKEGKEKAEADKPG